MRRAVAGTVGASLAVLAGGRLSLSPQLSDAQEKLKQESLVDLRAAGDDKQRPPPVEAAAVLHHRGFATLHNALAESQLGHDAQQGLVQAARSVDAGAAAALAGTLAASLLPTVHNNDAYFRQAMGAQLGERAAALAFAALPEPSLLGCTQAVAKLVPLATRPWRSVSHPPPRVRALTLEDGAADEDLATSLYEEDSFEVLTRTRTRALRALGLAGAATNAAAATGDARTAASAQEDGGAGDDTEWLKGLADGSIAASSILNEEEEEEEGMSSFGRGVGGGEAELRGVSPMAALLRAWVSVLLAPVALWAPILDASCAQERRALQQYAITLLVPDHDPASDGPAVWATPAAEWAQRAASWPRAGPVDGLTILLPLPLPLPALADDKPAHGEAHEEATLAVELLLPGLPWETGAPSIRVQTAAGDALVLDGRTRWRLAPEPPGGQRCCVVVYEYRPRAAAGLAALPARFVEALGVTSRAALALVVGGPPPSPSI